MAGRPILLSVDDDPEVLRAIERDLRSEYGEHYRVMRESVPAFALFIFIGAQPCTEWLGGLVACDERGFILSGPDLPRDASGKRVRGWREDREPYLLETSIPGIFVAGDARHGSVKRVASGVGEGAIAVSFIHQYLSRLGAGANV